MTAFLRAYEPNRENFIRAALRRPYSLFVNEARMRGVLRIQTSHAFADWLEACGVPPLVVQTARGVYEFDFEIREPA